MKTQMINNKIKLYPKASENLSKDPSQKILENIGSSFGTPAELAAMFRSFYRSAHPVLFDMIVKEVWLEQKFLYGGVRRGRRSKNGYGADWAFNFFMTGDVGISQKPLTTGAVFITVPTYFKDFFPNFSDHNPFEEPEYFKFPYSHVTLDFLLIVYQHDERIQMLDYAEQTKMNIREFCNWSANQAMSYNAEKGEEVYSLKRNSYIPYIRKAK